MKTLITFIFSFILVVSLNAQQNKAPVMAVPGFTFSFTDVHAPITTGEPTRFLIKGGAGGFDTTAVISLEGCDSVQINIAVSDSVNMRVIGRSAAKIADAYYYGDTTCIFNGTNAGFTQDVIGSGIVKLAWHQIVKTIHTSNSFQLILYFDTASRLESAGKRAMIQMKKFLR